MATLIDNYCTFTYSDIMALPDDLWIIFGGDMSTGCFISEEVARSCNEKYLEWEWEEVEYITTKEFKKRLLANNELELEPFGDDITYSDK